MGETRVLIGSSSDLAIGELVVESIAESVDSADAA